MFLALKRFTFKIFVMHDWKILTRQLELFISVVKCVVTADTHVNDSFIYDNTHSNRKFALVFILCMYV